ncbi:hypothetical protein C7S13_4989 [Burkholderia cepacia]|nr:hypothetical protein [Burkholderia cepacia]
MPKITTDKRNVCGCVCGGSMSVRVQVERNEKGGVTLLVF